MQGRFSELGAQVFYPHMEADEVDGLEEFVDKWIAGLWKPLKQAALGTTQVNQTSPPSSPLFLRTVCGGILAVACLFPPPRAPLPLALCHPPTDSLASSAHCSTAQVWHEMLGGLYCGELT